MECIATTTGLYPLPEDAKDTLADLKGHQREDLISGDETGEIPGAYADARQWAIETQQTSGLDRIVEGQLRWDDMLAHPLCVHDNVRTAGIVRYYNNNNFYREPVVEGELTPDGDVAAELDAAGTHIENPSARQAVLPGPYTLADLASDEYYGDERSFLAAVGDFLAGEVAKFPEVETLFLLEPSLVTAPPGSGRDAAASDAIDTVAGETTADIVVHTYWDAMEEKVYAHLLDAAVDAVGIDLVTEAAREPSIELFGEYGAPDDVALGVVDGQNTAVESPATVADRVGWFEEALADPVTFERAYLTTNTEGFYLPVSRFEQKLESLAQGAQEGSQ